MKKLLVVLSCVVVTGLAAPVPASAEPHGCDASDTLCTRHCLAIHRGVDRAVCLVDHNVALPPNPS
jgi:hypothetical protein